MSYHRILILFFLSVLIVLPFSCKKDKGKTFSIAFDITGRIVKDCDSTPVSNFPVMILVPCTFYEKLDYHSTRSGFATSSEFRTDINGYYHIQTTMQITNVLTVSNDYSIVNKDMFNSVQVFTDGGIGFNFTSGNVKDAYLKSYQKVVFNNCASLIIDSNFVGKPNDSIAPIYLHKSNVRDSSLNKRVQIYSKNGAIISNDSLLSISQIDPKSWYTYETRKKVGSSIIFVKDSFFTGCKNRVLINL